MSEEYRQYLNRLHNCEFTVNQDPQDVNVVHYINESKHIVVTALSTELPPAPNVVPTVDDKLKHLLKEIKDNQRAFFRKVMAMGFGIGFAVGFFVATASIYVVQVVLK